MRYQCLRLSWADGVGGWRGNPAEINRQVRVRNPPSFILVLLAPFALTTYIMHETVGHSPSITARLVLLHLSSPVVLGVSPLTVHPPLTMASELIC